MLSPCKKGSAWHAWQMDGIQAARSGMTLDQIIKAAEDRALRFGIYNHTPAYQACYRAFIEGAAYTLNTMKGE